MKQKVDKVIRSFFDFYAINELYLYAGGFRNIGYENYSKFVSHNIEERLKYKYEEVVENFYEDILKALASSIHCELRHFPSKCCYDYEFTYENIINKTRFSKREIKRALKCRVIDVQKYAEVIHAIFYIPRWYYNYGGKKWAKAAKLMIDSKSLKTLASKVYWIDQVLDLYHNTGHLLNKTKFEVLSSDKLKFNNISLRGWTYMTPLNIRKLSSSAIQFIPFVSDDIKRLLIPRKNILTFNS